jgi:WD40 repeat protein
VLTFKAHKKPIYAVAFSPDGKQLATSSGDETVRLWNLDDPTELRAFPGSGFIAPITFSPDGKFLARGGYGVAVWDVESGAEIITYKMTVETVAFSPDGTEVATFGSDSVLMRWSIPKGESLLGGWGGDRSDNNGDRFPAGAMTYSPDGTVIVTCYGVLGTKGFNSRLLLWDRKTGKQRGELVSAFTYGHLLALTYSPDGAVIAGNYGPVLGVIDVKSGKQVAGIKPGAKHFKGLAFTPNGKRLIAVNTDATVRVYDTTTWTETAGYE